MHARNLTKKCRHFQKKVQGNVKRLTHVIKLSASDIEFLIGSLNPGYQLIYRSQFDLVWKTIAPGVARVVFLSAGSESLLRKNKGKQRKERNTRQCHLNITIIKATKFNMTLFNGTYL